MRVQNFSPIVKHKLAFEVQKNTAATSFFVRNTISNRFSATSANEKNITFNENHSSAICYLKDIEGFHLKSLASNNQKADNLSASLSDSDHSDTDIINQNSIHIINNHSSNFNDPSLELRCRPSDDHKISEKDSTPFKFLSSSLSLSDSSICPKGFLPSLPDNSNSSGTSTTISGNLISEADSDHLLRMINCLIEDFNILKLEARAKEEEMIALKGEIEHLKQVNKPILIVLSALQKEAKREVHMP